MDILIGTIGGFLLGVVTAPLLVKAYQVYAERKIQQAYEETHQRAETEHAKQMEILRNEWNANAALFNQQLANMKRKLALRGLFVETDENGKEIIVRRIRISGEQTSTTKPQRNLGGGSR